MRRAAVLLTLAALVAACGPGTGRGQQAALATTAPTATPLPPDAPIPGAFRGVWTAGRNGGSQSHGAWTLRIGEQEMELLNPVAASDAEFFPLHARAATQEGVSFYTDPDCEGASYRWALDGDTLTFTPIGLDPCPDRWSTLTGDPWQRVASS